MTRALVLGMLFAAVVVSPSWAQNSNGPKASDPTYPGGSQITFQWEYSCPSGGDCSFTCGSGGGSHVTKLGISVGVIPIGTDQKNATLLYEFTTRESRRGSGFSINTGLSTLQCQINGLTMDYSGPPRGGQRTIDTTVPMAQSNGATSPATVGATAR